MAREAAKARSARITLARVAVLVGAGILVAVLATSGADVAPPLSQGSNSDARNRAAHVARAPAAEPARVGVVRKNEVTGSVTYNDAPVAGAHVRLVGGDFERSASTGADGAFTLDVPSSSKIGPCFLECSATGYDRLRRPADLTESTHFDLRLERTRLISVSVDLRAPGRQGALRLFASIEDDSGERVRHGLLDFVDGVAAFAVPDRGQSRFVGYLSVLGTRVPLQGETVRDRGEPFALLASQEAVSTLKLQLLDSASRAPITGAVWVKSENHVAQMVTMGDGRVEMAVPESCASNRIFVFWSSVVGVSGSLTYENLSSDPRIALGDFACRIRVIGRDVTPTLLSPLGSLGECQFHVVGAEGELVAHVPPGDYSARYDGDVLGVCSLAGRAEAVFTRDAVAKATLHGTMKQPGQLVVVRLGASESIVFDNSMAPGAPFAMKDLAPGDYALSARFGGAARLTMKLALAPGQDLNVGELGSDDLRKRTLTFVSEAGVPLSDRPVTWSERPGHGVNGLTAITDRSGVLALAVSPECPELMLQLEGIPGYGLVRLGASDEQRVIVVTGKPTREVKLHTECAALKALFVHEGSVWFYNCSRVGTDVFSCHGADPTLFLASCTNGMEPCDVQGSMSLVRTQPFPETLVLVPVAGEYRAACSVLGRFQSSEELFVQKLKSSAMRELRVRWPSGSAGLLSSSKSGWSEPFHVP